MKRPGALSCESDVGNYERAGNKTINVQPVIAQNEVEWKGKEMDGW